LLKADKALVSKSRIAPGLTELFNEYLRFALKGLSFFYPGKSGTVEGSGKVLYANRLWYDIIMLHYNLIIMQE
jgi:hypothetical protein